MENPAPAAQAAPETGIPVTEPDAPEIDFAQPLELVADDGTVRPVRLCPDDKLPHWVETNPDADGDFWLLLPFGQRDKSGAGGESRFCSDVMGDAQPWGTVRNSAAASGASA